MFHRVKSDVQGAEQTKQQEVEKGYRLGNESGQLLNKPSTREQETPSVNEGKKGRSYGSAHTKTQEETVGMRTREEEPVQSSKYDRNTEEERASEPAARASYQPSVSTRPTGYTGSTYAGTSYTAPNASDTYTGGDRTLTIGRGINMSGEIDACDHLMVEGVVEAALKGAKLLEIAESGVFYGTVEIEEATIAGRFEGDITVNGRLTIKSTGVITGSVAYRELEVETGAVLDGRMTPLKGTVDTKSADRYRAGSDASAMAKTKEPVSKKDNREPANTENGLFSKAHTPY